MNETVANSATPDGNLIVGIIQITVSKAGSVNN